MFESVIAYILNKYLAGYIGELDYKNLQLGLFSGKLTLNNIKIQPSALYQFDIPIEVKCGKIGSLNLTIDYKNIMSKPTVATIEDLFILLAPFEDKKYDPKRIEELNSAFKRKELLETEKIERAQIFDTKEKGFAERVQDGIINNIQIYVNNVHIRYEDKHSIKNKVVSFGLYFRNFRAETVDINGKSVFADSSAKTIYKVGILTGFNVYWNCDDKKESLISTNLDEKKEEWIKILKESISSGEILKVKFGKFLNKDLNLETKLILNRSYDKLDFEAPKIIFQSLVSSIEFVFQRYQYKNIFEIIDYYTMLNINKQFVKYRPIIAIKKGTASLWWKYAFTSVCESRWRSYRFDRMKNHFRKFNEYLQRYEKKLRLKCDDKELGKSDAQYLELLENILTLESIRDARFYCKENVKPYESEANKKPAPSKKSWFSSYFSSSKEPKETKDESVMLSKADKEVLKLNNVAESAEEKKETFDGRPLNYVEFRLILNFPHISLTLKTIGYEILKLSFSDILTLFEIKPVANSIYFLINTRSIDIDGVYYKQEIKEANSKMVPMVRSRLKKSENSTNVTTALLATECKNDILFTFAFETNPIGKENAEFSIRANIHSLEINYEKTIVNELIKFVKTDLIDFEDGGKMIKDIWSKAGVSYAVESHKQIHVDAKLSSPFFIIPSKGTCQEEGDLLVCYLGTTQINSELQPKRKTFTPKDIQDLKNNFYDKLNLDVLDVQVIFTNSRVDWRSYVENTRSNRNKKPFIHHILLPVNTRNTLYLTINPNYKKLPMFRVDAECESIHINFSDKKIIALSEFIKELSDNLPKVPSTPSPSTNIPQIASATPIPATPIPASTPTATKPVLRKTNAEEINKNNNYPTIQSSQNAFMEEPDHEWDGAFRLPTQINGNPIPNYPKISISFSIKQFMILLNSSQLLDMQQYDENEYLKLSLDDIKLDFAVTKFGSASKAKIGQLLLQVEDADTKVNGRYTEILYSPKGQELIEFWFRQVDTDAPNFKTLYQNIMINLRFECNNIQVVCHRTIIVNFLNYAKGITDNLSISDKTEIPESELNKPKAAASSSTQPSIEVNNDVYQLNIIANMKEFSWKMYDTNVIFGDMKVTGLSLKYRLMGIKTELKVKLSEIIINYTGKEILDDDKTDKKYKMNEYYREIISCTAEENKRNFFDFSLELYDVTNLKDDKKKYKDFLKLNVGKIKIIALIKFINELQDFFEPIINPLPTITEQVREQAKEAVNLVKNRMHDSESDGKQINIEVIIKSPKVIIPQNSGSDNAFLIDLGNLNVSNTFRPSKARNDLTVDDILLTLDNVEINRILFNKEDFNNPYAIREKVVDKITLKANLARLIKGDYFATVLALDKTNGMELPADIDIKLNISKLSSTFSIKSAKLLFSILDENVSEGIDPNKIKVPKSAEDRLSIFNGSTHETKSINESTKIIPIKKQDDHVVVSTSLRQSLRITIDLKEIKLVIVEFSKSPLTLERSVSAQNGNQSMNSKGNQVFFSDFRIKEIDFEYIKEERNYWFAELKMKELVLNDVRPNSNLAVKEMFIPLKKDTMLITLKYEVDPGNNAKLNFTMGNIQINLCLPYILKLYQMSMDAIGMNDDKKDAQQAKKPAKNVQNTTKVTPAEEQSSSTLNVHGEIYLPQVILFAKPEKKDSKVMIMNTKVIIKFNSEKGKTSLGINLSELGMRLGEYNKINKKGIDFLSPCKAELLMTQKPGQKVAYYKTNIETLRLNMTPTLYEVVMGVVNSINMSGTEKQIDETKKKDLTKDSEPFIVRPDSKENYLIKNCDLENQVDEELIQGSTIRESTIAQEKDVKINIETEVETNKCIEALDLAINELVIVFCDESAIELQPLAEIRIMLDAQVSNWTKNLHVKANLALEATYFNDNLSNWEPLIENVMEREDHYRPWNLKVWFCMEPGSVLKPPKAKETLEFVDFEKLVQSLDYSLLENELKVMQKQPESDNIYITEHVSQAYSPLSLDSVDQSKPRLSPEKQTIQTASYILIESQDILNLNVTPSAYKVIMYLAQLTAGSKKEEVLENRNKPLLKMCNFLGIKADLFVSDKLVLKKRDAIGFIVNSSAHSSEQSIKTTSDQKPRRLFNIQTSQIDSVYDDLYKIQVEINGYKELNLSIKTDGNFMVPLKKIDSPEKIDNTKYYIMYKVQTIYGRHKIIFSSPTQIQNETKVKLYILIKLTNEMLENKEKWNIKEEIFNYPDEENFSESHSRSSFAVVYTLLPGKVYYLPLNYAYHCQIYATPNPDSYAPSRIFDMRGYNFKIDHFEDIVCQRLDRTGPNTSINTSDTACEMKNFELLRKLTVNVRKHNTMVPNMNTNFNVILYAPFTLVNNLPFILRFDIDDKSSNSKEIKPGQSLNIYLPKNDLKTCKLQAQYLETTWVGDFVFESVRNPDVYPTMIKMDISQNNNNMYVSNKHLNIHFSFEEPNELSFYCPYWIINKTGKSLQMRSQNSQNIFDIEDDTIILFDYKNSVEKSNKAKLAIKDCVWSVPFSLDAVGTHGTVECKDSVKTNFTILIKTTMSNSSRTKLITFAPYLQIINELDDEVMIAESPPRFKFDWKGIETIKSTAKPVVFWPEYHSFKQLKFIIRNNSKMSKEFPLINPSHFVLMMNEPIPDVTSNEENQREEDKLLTVLISGGNNDPITLIIRKYQYGDAVAKFVNLCDDIKISIHNDKNDPLELESCKSMFFIWPELVQSKRSLSWSIETSIENKPYPVQDAISGTEHFQIEFSANQEPPLSEDINASGGSDSRLSYHLEDAIVNAEQSAYKSKDDAQNSLISRESRKRAKSNKNKKGSVESKKRDIWCVSYMDGEQRVILFTTDQKFTELTRKEASGMEIYTKLNGIEVSVINNDNLEVALIAITGSKPVWVVVAEQTTKTFSEELSEWLENNYRDYLINHKDRIFSTNISGIYSFSEANKFKVNFKEMKIELPIEEGGKLVRTFYAGLRAQYRTSRNMVSLKCCINNLQIDNQLPDAYFPISLYRAPNVLKETNVPFLDFSLFTEQQEVLQIYRYFEFIVQELHLKVDKGFLDSLKDWYDATSETKEKNATDSTDSAEEKEENFHIMIYEDPEIIKSIEADLKLTKEIIEYIDKSGVIKQSALIHFDYFRIAPILCSLSFSVQGKKHVEKEKEKNVVKGNQHLSTILNFFLESIGTTITEFKDVKFRFAIFQTQRTTKTWEGLYNEVFDHYKMQGLRQAYVLILGLDVLGNPFGLVTDFTEGLSSLFYDPLLGYLTKPSVNQANNIHMGHKVQQTVNKTISSAAGSASLISGSIGRVFATMTFDDEYKQRRLYKLSNTSTMNVKDSFAVAGKGMIFGIIDGISGTVKQPYKMRKKNVVAGIGKGLIGIIAKPLSSLFDGISMTFDGLKRSQGGSNSVVNHTRLPRHLIEKIPLLPYSAYQSAGYKILRDLQNDGIAQGEFYWAHFFPTSRPRSLLFITNTYIYMLKKTLTEIFSVWELIKKPISIYKIKLEKRDIKQNNLNNRKSVIDINTTTQSAPVATTITDLIAVTVEKNSNTGLLGEVEILIASEESKTIEWIEEKIYSAIKYHNETKGIFSSLDD